DQVLVKVRQGTQALLRTRVQENEPQTDQVQQRDVAAQAHSEGKLLQHGTFADDDERLPVDALQIWQHAVQHLRLQRTGQGAGRYCGRRHGETSAVSRRHAAAESAAWVTRSRNGPSENFSAIAASRLSWRWGSRQGSSRASTNSTGLSSGASN